MVRAKDDPTRRVLLFEPTMSAAMLERIDLENDLRSRARARRAALSLPADRRPPRRPDRRVRGAGPLAAPDPRPHPAALVHPAGGGDRAHRPARALGARDGLPPGGRVARPHDRARRWSCRSTCPPASSSRPDLVDEVERHPDETGLDANELELEITEIGADGPIGERRPDAPAPARARRPAGARRLRDRLLVVVLPQAPAPRHDQDRPVVRRRDSTARRTARSSRRSSRSPTASASGWSPRASRPRRSTASSSSSAATWGRATCSRRRCRESKRRGC